MNTLNWFRGNITPEKPAKFLGAKTEPRYLHFGWKDDGGLALAYPARLTARGWMADVPRDTNDTEEDGHLVTGLVAGVAGDGGKLLNDVRFIRPVRKAGHSPRGPWVLESDAHGLVNYLLEEEDADDEVAYAKAEEYFSIGHHNAHTEFEEYPDREPGEDVFDWRKRQPKKDTCWIWNGTGLQTAQGHTHYMSFGTDQVNRAPFKGWYDASQNLVSFVDQRRNPTVNSVDDIPARVYQHLKREFKPDTFRVF